MNKWRLALKNEGLIRKINLQADIAVRWRAKIEGELPFWNGKLSLMGKRNLVLNPCCCRGL